MNVATLRYLLESFEEDRRYYHACSALANDPEQRDEYERRTQTIALLIARVRGEIFARESSGTRAPDEAQCFEVFLQRALKNYPNMDREHGDGSPAGSSFDPFMPLPDKTIGLVGKTA